MKVVSKPSYCNLSTIAQSVFVNIIHKLKPVIRLGPILELAFEKSQKTSIFELKDWKVLNLFYYVIAENLNSIWRVRKCCCHSQIKPRFKLRGAKVLCSKI